jgi:hypothetical protein
MKRVLLSSIFTIFLINIYFVNNLSAQTFESFLDFTNAQANNDPNNWTKIDTTLINEINTKIDVVKAEITLFTEPAYPLPNSTATVKLRSYSLNLDEAFISWFVDGASVISGVGVKTIDIKTGKSGEKLDVRAVIKDSGKEYVKELKNILSEVYIYNEPQTSTFPFYKGKSLMTPLSTNKFIAVTNLFDNNGNKIKDKDIVFTWRIDGSTDSKSSGTGKNTYIHKSNSKNPFFVAVTAKAIGYNIDGQSIKKFTFSDPKVLFYEITPTLGKIFDRAIRGGVRLTKSEVSILSQPLFFDNDKLDKLRYVWYKDTAKILTQKNASTLTFGKTPEMSGISQIMVFLDDPENSFVESKAMFNIEYNIGEAPRF